MNRFSRSEFTPVGYSYLKSETLNESLKENGFAIVPFLNEAQLEGLRVLYDKFHRITAAGAYFSLYNNDLNYRHSVYTESLAVLSKPLDSFFENYHAANSGFVVRGPNDEGEFFIHQDPSFVDETISSPLHVWCPLYNVTMDYAPVCVFPKSHQLAPPLRSPTIPFSFDNVRHEIRKYMQPLEVKAGEAIFLDPRLMHNSLPNKRNEARPVLLIQIFRKGEQLIVPFLNRSEIEIYSIPDDYFLKNTKFYQDVMGRPELGTYLNSVPYEAQPVTTQELNEFCRKKNINATSMLTDLYKNTESIINIG